MSPRLSLKFKTEACPVHCRVWQVGLLLGAHQVVPGWCPHGDQPSLVSISPSVYTGSAPAALHVVALPWASPCLAQAGLGYFLLHSQECLSLLLGLPGACPQVQSVKDTRVCFSLCLAALNPTPRKLGNSLNFFHIHTNFVERNISTLLGFVNP